MRSRGLPLRLFHRQSKADLEVKIVYFSCIAESLGSSLDELEQEVNAVFKVCPHVCAAYHVPPPNR